MKKKELKNLAAKIAKCERIIQTSDDKKAVRQAEEEIMRLSINDSLKGFEVEGLDISSLM